jgi:hypothetical protein
MAVPPRISIRRKYNDYLVYLARYDFQERGALWAPGLRVISGSGRLSKQIHERTGQIGQSKSTPEH